MMRMTRGRWMALVAAVAATAGAISAVAADDRPAGLGQSPASDRGARTVAATPVTSPDVPPPSRGKPASRVDLASRLGVLRRARSDKDRPPQKVAPMPGLRIDHDRARRVDGVKGTGPMWIVPDASDRWVALVGAGRESWYAAIDLAAGRILRVSEMLEDDPMGVAVSGFLPDGSHDVTITSGTGTRQVTLAGGFYSERFEKTKAGLPRTLSWRDADGAHELQVPLSPDMPS